MKKDIYDAVGENIGLAFRFAVKVFIAAWIVKWVFK